MTRDGIKLDGQRQAPKARAPEETFKAPFFWPKSAPWTPLGLTVAFLLVLTLLRLFTIFTTFINLGPEETQYWDWSRSFQFGYFSKPPVIAWIIGLTTLFSDSPGFVRLGAPLLHAGTALLVFKLAENLFGGRIAFWSALTFATLPGIVLSGVIVTTDVPLLFFWALALLSLERLVAGTRAGTPALKWAIGLGVGVGLGLMSKYSMSFFILGTAIYVAVCADARRALLSRQGLTAAAIAAVLFTPNVLWNMASDFATIEHTAANGNWKGDMFNFDKLGEFIASQVSVFGPIPMIAFLFGLVTLGKKRKGPYADSDTFLLSYCLPVLAVILVQAFLSRANANWAAPAYVATCIITVSWMLREGGFWGRRLIAVSFIISVIAISVFHACTLVPGLIEVLGREREFKTARGWDALAAEIHQQADGQTYAAIMGDDRLLVSEINYYARNVGPKIIIWDPDHRPQNHFEQNSAFKPGSGEPILYVAISRNDRGEKLAFYETVLAHFTATELKTVEIAKGGAISAEYKLYHLSGYDLPGDAAAGADKP